MGFDSALQLTFKKLLINKFWYCVKEEYPQLSEKNCENTPPSSKPVSL